jgi:RimJ/RimL family protein N-acetyltransferase
MLVPSTPAWARGDVELFLLDAEHVSERYVQWLNDPAINRYLESRFQQHTIESTRAFVQSCARNTDQFFAGIRYRPLGGRHVGNIKIDLNRKHGLGEVGILIGETAVHGKGIASEAIRIAATIARAELSLRKLTAGCYESNKGSERAFVKAGFSVEGRRPGHFLLEGRPEALILLGLML